MPRTCAFRLSARNPYLISPEELYREGLLDSVDLDRGPEFPVGKVDYEPVMEYKLAILRKSFDSLRDHHHRTKYPESFYAFIEWNTFWLEDYVLFVALKGAHGGLEWTLWENDARKREPDGLVEYSRQLAELVSTYGRNQPETVGGGESR